MRTHKSHAHHVQLALSSSSSVTETGVTGDTVLNDLEHFCALENYTPDIMHDILEEVCPCELKLVLNYFILSKGLFSVDVLNERIRTFNYGLEESGSKPVEITKKSIQGKDGTIKQSASEMWCLFRNLPMMIGDLIPADDPYWELILGLLGIMSMLFAPAITRDATFMLEILINDHLELFKQLYPEEKIKPKQHYLVHYPRCIRKVGPLVKFWVMRFEAKHNFFRRLSHVVCNFKNICKTMAYRHQYAQCYRFYMNKNINDDAIEVGKGSVNLLADVPECDVIRLACGSIGLYENIFMAKWIRVHGTLYRPGMFVVAHVDTNDALPDFGKILSIVVIPGKTLLTIEEWNTKYFHKHLNAYAIEPLVTRKTNA